MQYMLWNDNSFNVCYASKTWIIYESLSSKQLYALLTY